MKGALDVACPQCGVPAGVNCENKQWEIYHAARLMAVDFDEAPQVFHREGGEVYVSVAHYVGRLAQIADDSDREGKDAAIGQVHRFVIADLMTAAAEWLSQSMSDVEIANGLTRNLSGQDAWLGRLLVRTLFAASEDEKDEALAQAMADFAAIQR